MASLKSNLTIFFIMFIGAMIAITFIDPISDSVTGQTNTITVTNVTVTAPAINVSLDVQGRTLLSETNVSEATNVSNVSNGMFLRTGFTSGGLRSVQLFLNDTAEDFVGVEVNVSYTADPDGYLSDGGSRSITTLIILFSALAIVIFIIIQIMGSEALKNIMGRK